MKLLLDEHISPAVARGLVEADITAEPLRDWHAGAYLEAGDDVILSEAHTAGWTLVTYDRRSIAPLLKTWVEQGLAHGGVVFVDERTIAQHDIGGLIRALRRLAAELGDVEWEQRVVFLRC